MDNDLAKLPPDYVSLAQLRERWLQKQQREKEERESGLNQNRFPPELQQRSPEKEAREKPKKETESGTDENRERRLPPDYVSLAQLQERWLEKQQREKETRENRERESAELQKSDRRASYGDKGKWKEEESYGNGEEIKMKIPSNRGKGGIQIDKGLKLKAETDNGGSKGGFSGDNSGDGGSKGETGNQKDFDRGSGYNSKRGNNYRGRFNQLKETQVHKTEDKKGFNRNWTEKRRNGDNNGDKEGSYRLKEPELEKKLDSENSEICSEMDVVRDRKNGSDDHVVERERLNGEKAEEEELVLAVENVNNINNNNGRRGFGNWRNRNKRGGGGGGGGGGQEGSYRLKEPELEKKLDSENSEICSEMDVIRDTKNGSDDRVVERERLNGEKAEEEELVLAVETVKNNNNNNNNGRRGFGNWRNRNKRGGGGGREGSYRLKEPELEKKLDSENSEICSEMDVIRDTKNGSDDCVVERERLNGEKAEEEELVLAVENVKNINNNNGRRGFGNWRNRNKRGGGGREGSYRLTEPELEKKSGNANSEVCNEIDVTRDRNNASDGDIVEREVLNGKKVMEEMVLAVESVKIGKNGDKNSSSKNGRGKFQNRRNGNNRGAREGSYRSQEPELKNKSDNENSKVCSEMDVKSDRKNDSDDHVVERKGSNGKKEEEEMILAEESVKIGENQYRGHENNRGSGFGNQRNGNRGAREGSYRSKELWLEKKLDNEYSKACSKIDAKRDRKNGDDAHIVERKGLNGKKVNGEMVLAVESVKIGENGNNNNNNNNGRRGLGKQRNDKNCGSQDGSYRSKELWLEKKPDNEKPKVCSVISGINDVSRDRNNVGDDHIAVREGLNDNVSAKAEEEIVFPVEGVGISENGYRRHGNNNGRRFSSYRKANDGGRTRYGGPRIFEGGRETKVREMSGMVWVKKEDGTGG